MNILVLLARLNTILSTYGPLAIQASQYIIKGDWTGLVKWIETLLIPTPSVPAPPASELEPVLADLKSHLITCGAIPA